MKVSLFVISLLVVSNFSFAAEKSANVNKRSEKIIDKTIDTGVVSYSAGLSFAAAKSLSYVTCGACLLGARLMAFSGVILAGTAGYMVGSIIVQADKTYFEGSLVSKTGEILGPVFEQIYNATHDDKLPKILKTKNDSYAVIKQGDKIDSTLNFQVADQGRKIESKDQLLGRIVANKQENKAVSK